MRRFTVPSLLMVFFYLYFSEQVCPSFYFWDSAELTAAVLGNGVPHPPGFPFFLILSNLWLILFGTSGSGVVAGYNNAHLLNLFSAFFAALGLALWYAVIVRIIAELNINKNRFISEFIASIVVMILGISFSFGIQATRFEVYSLNFVGYAALMLVALKIAESDNAPFWWSLLLFLGIGLFLGVHSLTIALAVPGILLIPLIKGRIKPKYILAGMPLSLAIMMVAYLAILFRAGQMPDLNWGYPSNLSKLWDCILLKGFQPSGATLTLSHLISNLTFVLDLFIRQFGLLSLLFCLWGFLFMILRQFKIGAPLLIILLMNMLSTLLSKEFFYENYDLHGYLLLSMALISLGLAVSLTLLFNAAKIRLEMANKRYSFAPAFAVTALAILILFAGPFRQNLYSADLSNNDDAYRYAENYLVDMPDSSIVITSSFNTYFTLLAYANINHNHGWPKIINLYHWDQDWGKELTNDQFGITLKTNYKLPFYYRNFINSTMNRYKLFIEYDQASVSAVNFLKPDGYRYYFTFDSLYNNTWNFGILQAEIMKASYSAEIENIRTHLLWFKNRADYYERIGADSISVKYLNILDPLVNILN